MRYVATRVCASVNEWCGRDGSGCGWWPVRGPKPRCARRSAGDSTLSRVVRDTDARVCGHTEKSPRMSTRPSVRVRRAGASSQATTGAMRTRRPQQHQKRANFHQLQRIPHRNRTAIFVQALHRDQGLYRAASIIVMPRSRRAPPDPQAPRCAHRFLHFLARTC